MSPGPSIGAGLRPLADTGRAALGRAGGSPAVDRKRADVASRPPDEAAVRDELPIPMARTGIYSRPWPMKNSRARLNVLLEAAPEIAPSACSDTRRKAVTDEIRRHGILGVAWQT